MTSLAHIPEALVSPEPIWRLSVDQYHEMVRLGILGEDDPIELLEGLLVLKMTKNPSHSGATRRTRTRLESILPEGWFVDTQEPITTLDSEPEPDIAIIRGDDTQYDDRHPIPSEVALLIEVADSSLQRDQTLKKRIYARAGIAVYWVMNLLNRRIEVYTEPDADKEPPDYRQRQDYGLDDEVPVVIEGMEIGKLAVKDLLP